ncbi:MAG: hypothetical protein ACRD1V_16450 [Vicinamibacterales bacterium]
MTRHLPAAIAILALASPAFAQKVTTVSGLTGQQVLSQMSDGAATGVGEAIAVTAALEIATEPLATSSGGFIFKLDPSTGLLARTTTTFGPSFTERALTSGEGRISIGANFSSTSFNKLGDFSLSSLPLASIKSSGLTATGTYAITEQTVNLSTTVGVTDNVDVAVVVPLVSLKVSGSSTVFNASGVDTRLAQTDGVFSGLGDVSALAKMRVFRFAGTGITDPGGVALLVNVRLPTGSRDNLRGLGITRALVGGVFSMDRGRVRPHANAGFEYWTKGLSFAGSDGQNITIRHQVQYAGWVEIEAAPKLTIIVDYLGQRILGGGQIGVVSETPASGLATDALSLLPNAINKMYLAPGMKVNLKGKMLLSLNALVTMKNNGLHARVTPMVGLILSM